MWFVRKVENPIDRAFLSLSGEKYNAFFQAIQIHNGVWIPTQNGMKTPSTLMENRNGFRQESGEASMDNGLPRKLLETPSMFKENAIENSRTAEKFLSESGE